MAYRPQRDTSRDRVRAVVGDVADPPRLAGGEAAYDAIVAAAVSEHWAARLAARDLAAEISKDPDRLSDAGSAIGWGSRVAVLRAIADGTTPTGLAGDPALGAGPARPRPAAATAGTASFTRDMP